MELIMITSGHNFDGYTISKYLGYCSGESVLGTGFLSSLNSSIADILGKNSILYEDKLKEAKTDALRKLEQEALRLGANALIGIDVDYTMFSADIIGVIANGTAVIAELETHKFSADSGKTIPIINYNEDIPLRFLDVTLGECGDIALSFVPLANNLITAMNVSLTFNTIFDELIEIDPLSFVDIKADIGRHRTETNKDDNIRIIYKTVKTAIVHVNKCICNDTICDSCLPDSMIPLDQPELDKIRGLYGNDALCYYQNLGDVWQCICGKRNDAAVDCCPLCIRKRDAHQHINVETAYETILKIIDTHHTAKEIYDYIIRYNAEHNNIISEQLLADIKNCVLLERMYGNQKQSCMKKINAYAAISADPQ